jgi:hypothetical protein
MITFLHILRTSCSGQNQSGQMLSNPTFLKSLFTTWG